MNFFTFLLIFTFSTTLLVKAQIPNAGFENWKNGVPVGWWTNNNEIYSINGVTQSKDAESGTSAVKCEVLSFVGMGYPTVLGSGGHQGSKFYINKRYTAINGFYKLKSIGGDRLDVEVYISKKGNNIGYGKLEVSKVANKYLPFSVKINYNYYGNYNNEVPDSLELYFSMRAVNNDADLHIGSYVLLDNLTLSPATVARGKKK